MQPIEVSQMPIYQQEKYPMLRGIIIMALAILGSFLIPFVSIIAAGYIGYDVTIKLRRKKFFTSFKIFLIVLPVQFIIDYVQLHEYLPEMKAEVERLMTESELVSLNMTADDFVSMALIFVLLFMVLVSLGIWCIASLIGSYIGNSANRTNRRYGVGGNRSSLREQNPLYPPHQGQVRRTVPIYQQTNKICQYCQTENPGDSRFCIKCGAHILEAKKAIVKNQQKCDACNAPLSGDMLFCGNCGSRIKKQE